MNLKALLIATGIAVAAGSVAPVAAQTVVTTRTTTVHRETGMRPAVVVRERHHRRQVCRVTWRNHHKVRRCYWR